MSRKAYRSASTHQGLWVAICMAGLVAQTALITYFASNPATKHWSAWAFVPMTLPFFIAIVLAVFTIRRRIRKRRRIVTEGLAAAGYTVTPAPSAEEKEQFFQRIAVFKKTFDLRTDAAGLQWYALRECPGGGGTELVCEYEFTSGSGKSTQEHIRMVTVLPHWRAGDPPPTGWHTGFLLARQGNLMRRRRRKQENPDPAFDPWRELFAVFGDTATGQRFLTPRLRDLLADSPKRESWSVGGDLLACYFPAPLDTKNLAIFLDRAGRAAAG